jgi:DOPA 4,5-dioxygenase
MPKRPENTHERYHAHVYFDESSVERAAALCLNAWQACHIGLGRLHRKPVGPHPLWSCQLSFDSAEFDRIVTWLDRHRGELDILVHPLTGDDLADHSEHATWLGHEVPLNLSMFER